VADLDVIANMSQTRVVQGIAANTDLDRIDIGVARGAVTEITNQIDALEPNDAKVVGSKTNSLVVPGPSMCDAGVPLW